MAFDTSQPAFQSLRDIVAERTTSLVFWIGSGLSVDADLPTWVGLKSRLIQTLKGKARSMEEPDSTKLLRRAAVIETQHNNWLAFQMLRAELGRTTYQSTIRESMSNAITVTIPSIYTQIWRLSPYGVLNLNIDGIATRAYTQVNPGKGLTEFYGRDAGDRVHILKSPQAFIANLHGKAEDSSSWVFAKDELDNLFSKAGYEEFIRICLSTNTLVFWGISADDLAVGGHLEILSQLGIDTGVHYWITNRRDSETDRWAERNNIRVIRYISVDGNHAELQELCQELISARPREEEVNFTPIVLKESLPIEGVLPTPEELSREDAETIRTILNSKASEILRDASPEGYEEYAKFSTNYDEAIYRAWYTSTSEGHDQLLGYTLDSEIARGAFGKVYRSQAPDGSAVAIKVLLEDVRRDQSLLQCFRRGVRSMRILSDRNVDGMVAYKEASEIPAFVVMEWIDGPNLNDAVKARQLDDWTTILRTASDVAKVIRKAHLLPERVLHRDLRPSNIMLNKFYSDHENWEVCVLDFDLSWHRDAPEISIVPANTSLGYLAPEQISQMQEVSTRHAAVDSFGMGMLLYFMASRRDPVPAQHLHETWKNDVIKVCGELRCRDWRSVPYRFGRLILNSTTHRQSDRWDMSQIEKELDRLYLAVLCPNKVESAEMIAEEVIARTQFAESYDWDPDRNQVNLSLSNGTQLSLLGNEADQLLYLELEWTNTEQQEHRRVSRWMPQAIRTANDILKSSGWKANFEQKFQSMQISATMSCYPLLNRLDECARNIDRAMEALRLD
ncbi:MAG: protein kinase [Dehalococcoidia bacterium]